jgi:dihydroorotase
MRTLIKNGHVIDPSQGLSEVMDILIEGKKIKAIEKQIDVSKMHQIIDAKGMIVTPGFVDAHVHLRDPGLTQKEDMASGTRGALKGGVTSLVCMPNTNPVMDSLEAILKLKKNIEEKAFVKVYVSGAISKGLQGIEAAESEEILNAGAVALTDDGRTTLDTKLMTRAFLLAKEKGALVMTHSEDHEITSKDKTVPSPVIAESEIVKRDIALASEVDGPLHVSHVSTKEALDAIQAAKKRGENVSCEVEPHHLILSDENCDPASAAYKVNPPIRSEVDRRAMIDGLKSGAVDMIATDHAPHELHTKKGTYKEASYGFSGIETAFPLCYTHLVKTGEIELELLVSLMTNRPAQRLGLNSGTLKVNAPADINIIDLEELYEIDPDQFETKGKNSPFKGWEVYGKVKQVFVDGKWSVKGGVIND